MKISNPQEYFINTENDIDYENYYTLIKRGDIITQWVSSSSIPYPDDWKFEKPSNPTWLRCSYDNGKTWFLTLKLTKNILFSKIIEIGSPEEIEMKDFISFDFSDCDILDEEWNLIKNSNVSFLAIAENKDEITNEITTYYTNISCFRYNFKDKTINVELLEDLPFDTIKIKLNIILQVI